MADSSLNHYTQNALIQETIKEVIKKSFPIEAGGKRLEITDVYIDDKLDSDDFPQQKEHKLNRRT
jgi:hypothetical protein